MMPEAESAAKSVARKATFEQALAQLGWNPTSKIAIDYRRVVNGPNSAARATEELLALKPDVIVAVATPAARAAYKAVHTIPVVFVAVSEPVSQGIVASLARPGGNLTGFSNLEDTLGAKWLELLKEIAPSVKHVGIIFNPDSAPFAVPIANATVAAAPKFELKAEFDSASRSRSGRGRICSGGHRGWRRSDVFARPSHRKPCQIDRRSV